MRYSEVGWGPTTMIGRAGARSRTRSTRALTDWLMALGPEAGSEGTGGWSMAQLSLTEPTTTSRDGWASRTASTRSGALKNPVLPCGDGVRAHPVEPCPLTAAPTPSLLAATDTMVASSGAPPWPPAPGVIQESPMNPTTRAVGTPGPPWRGSMFDRSSWARTCSFRAPISAPWAICALVSAPTSALGAKRLSAPLFEYTS